MQYTLETDPMHHNFVIRRAIEVRVVRCTVGNQADMTSSSIFQSLNIGMNTTIVSLSYPKTKFQKINSNPGKAHQQKYCS
jgi:hypothetical protein